MGAKTLRETRNDNNGDDNNISAPGPTWNEALQAALVLRKYVGTIDNAFAHKLEVMLGLFRQRTCAIEIQGFKDT
ncbi:hypothetical protein SERLADRAFT_374462 [Serpula lacrymans var. lacrymans S7.9]|uniref:Uncharacterized protein n=1 Tax=Serpula lacrymans var. lacrymans (strain S7.9) TaxID=578457 RepID=F8PBY0_SERL9|nr:uncharacterized protein SERLADRAFT_374462 [Serpula lacrymans var. lacrymans S7.9]EGO19183.1 hypothetical protein SERLADRAFT_374462 [Serpula lacrymans var. lacrymans S7.9]